jgi:hypothetical protein
VSYGGDHRRQTLTAVQHILAPTVGVEMVVRGIHGGTPCAQFYTMLTASGDLAAIKPTSGTLT